MRGWLERIQATAPRDYALACEIAECQRLIKGYGDTHARGLANYQMIMSALDGRTDVDALRVRALRDAALMDETGTKLREMLPTR
jgi:indolepyruvate ferredoxin oxidoreductase beta subunit